MLAKGTPKLVALGSSGCLLALVQQAAQLMTLAVFVIMFLQATALLK
jgi:hypothetical protein